MREREREREKQKIQSTSSTHIPYAMKSKALIILFSGADYAHVVFRSEDEHPLYNITKIHVMCQLEEEMIRTQPEFSSLCVRQIHSNECCRSWSVGSYIALLSGKASCEDITDADARCVRDMLRDCAAFYHDGSLTSDCWSLEEGDGLDSGLCNVPVKCKQHNAVYNILHYLTDVKFLSKEARGLSNTLTYAVTFLPIARSLASEDLYKAMEKEDLASEEVRIIAVDFGLKQQLFEFYLKKDMAWIFIAMLVVWFVMWIYTASLFLTFMTMVSVMFSLAIAYFIYTMVFKVEFFPFMNLLAIVILLGIGTDDVFIYSRAWTMAKLEKNVGTLEKVISDTLKHAALSMFVTSLTTACAFYANYVSDITALKCFGIYTGTAILINFGMMLTWIPASIVIQDKWCSDCWLCYSYDSLAHRNGILYKALKFPAKIYAMIEDSARIFFEKILAWIVIKLRILWILIFGGLGACSIVIVLYYPKMKLPASNQFQVFAEAHPFEVYDIQMKDQLWFEKVFQDSTGTMPITIVWGVKAVDNGNHLDPFSEGSLEYESSFSVSTKEAQSWLLNFCAAVRSLNIYQHESGPQLSNCFIENFKRFMERECTGVRGENLEPCCASSTFPYPADVFDRCLMLWIPMLTQSKGIYPSTNRIAGPRYSAETGEKLALIVEFYSQIPFSFNYKDIGEFYEEVESMMTRELEEAPTEMQKAWFTSHFDFYDLQASISSGTPFAIGVSLAIATLVAFMTTLNVLVTLYAMASIALSIFATVACLVLLGWELNILESVTISVAVGLSIDFTLHYGMAYRLAPDLDKAMRVNSATSRQGAPIAMAALTTFLAGALMMPSTILAYRQLGTFLMLVMLISWLYSNFFFLSLLKAIGPEGGFGQFHWPSCYCSWGRDEEHVDKTVYTMSDSNISRANSTEMHELEPLAERNELDSNHSGTPKRISDASLPRTPRSRDGSSLTTSTFPLTTSPSPLTTSSLNTPNSFKDEDEEAHEHSTLLSGEDNHDVETGSDDQTEPSTGIWLKKASLNGCKDEEEQERSTLLSQGNHDIEAGMDGHITTEPSTGIWLKKSSLNGYRDNEQEQEQSNILASENNHDIENNTNGEITTDPLTGPWLKKSLVNSL